jgi:hypothetical protein
LSKKFSPKRFVVDAGAMAIFWTILYSPVFLYTSRTIEVAAFGIGSSTALEILFGGVFGRFLDWFRKKFGIVPQSVLDRLKLISQTDSTLDRVALHDQVTVLLEIFEECNPCNCHYRY